MPYLEHLKVITLKKRMQTSKTSMYPLFVHIYRRMDINAHVCYSSVDSSFVSGLSTFNTDTDLLLTQTFKHVQ
jgi:hypothetical protein